MTISNFSINRFLYLILFLSAVVWAAASSPDPDFWGHTKYGLSMLEQGRLLRNDIYSYSVPGAPWTNHEWLSELTFGFVYKNYGFKGMVVVKMLLGLLTLSFIYKILTLNTIKIFERSVIFISIAFLMSPYFSMFRPQNFSYLFTAIYIYIFAKIYLNKKNEIPLHFLLPLPAIMIPWVNFHGGFLSGLGLFILFLIGYSIEKKYFSSRLFWTFLGAFACTFINPYGYGLYKYLYSDLVVPRISIVEWECLDPRYVAQWIYIGLCALTLVLSNKKKTFTPLLLFFVTLYLGLRYLKFFSFFLISSAMIIPLYAEDLFRNQYKILKEHSAPLSKIKKIILIFMLFILTVAIAVKIAYEFRHPFSAAKEDYPVNAVAYMKENKIKGNLLVTFNWAQYVIWYLYPDCKVLYDGRHRTVYPLSLEKEYFNFHFIKHDWGKILDLYPTDLILWDADTAHAELLEDKKEWEEIYSDKIAVLLKKKAVE